jgi:hypothetical protein
MGSRRVGEPAPRLVERGDRIDLLALTCYKNRSCATGFGEVPGPGTMKIRRGQAQHPCSSLAVEACSELRPSAAALCYRCGWGTLCRVEVT